MVVRRLARVRRSIRRRARTLVLYAYRPLALRSIGRDREVTVLGTRLAVPRGVFNPRLAFSSTRFVARELSRVEVAGAQLVEVGCGAGLLSILAAKRGAIVTALDINPAAVEVTAANASRNGVAVHAVVSDLFSALERRLYDVVMITPPYFRADPSSVEDQAWFAGANFEYYRALFAQLGDVIGPSSIVLIGQGEDSDVDAIGSIAASEGFRLELWARRLQWFDEQRLYRIVRY